MDIGRKACRPRYQLAMHLAREGRSFTVAGILIAIIVQIFAGGFWAIPFWILALFILQFFRDPVRQIPSANNIIVSPADGKVVAVGKSKDPVSGTDATRIAIFLNVFSVHATRIPVAGNILKQEYRSGKFLNAAVDKSSEENERNLLVIRTSDSREVTCIQIAGLIARRILCYVMEGESVELGQRYGFIRFGSRVELFVPADYKISVSVGDKVKGGSDIIGLTA